MMAWLAMGSYAAYVWPVVGCAFLLVIGVATAPMVMHRRLVRELASRADGD